MGEIRLHEGELNVMELLWSNQSLSAKDIAKIIKDYIGWEKNTTYTVIKRLIDKGAVVREEPGFICKAVVTKAEIQKIETKVLFDKLFGGDVRGDQRKADQPPLQPAPGEEVLFRALLPTGLLTLALQHTDAQDGGDEREENQNV